jgi:hypothetical protein
VRATAGGKTDNRSGEQLVRRCSLICLSGSLCRKGFLLKLGGNGDLMSGNVEVPWRSRSSKARAIKVEPVLSREENQRSRSLPSFSQDRWLAEVPGNDTFPQMGLPFPLWQDRSPSAGSPRTGLCPCLALPLLSTQLARALLEHTIKRLNTATGIGVPVLSAPILRNRMWRPCNPSRRASLRAWRNSLRPELRSQQGTRPASL